MVRAPHGEKTPALGGSRAAAASGLVLPHIPAALSSLWCLEKEKKQKGNESGLKGSAGGKALPAAPLERHRLLPESYLGWQIEASKAAFVLQLCAERWVFVLTPWPRFPTGALSVWEAGLSTSVPIAALWWPRKGCYLCHLCCAEVGQGCPWCSSLSGL